MKAQRILVPVDFSDASRRAVRLAVELARDSTGHITLLHVGTIHYSTSDLSLASATGELLVDLSRRVAAEQEQHLGSLASEEIPDVMEYFFFFGCGRLVFQIPGENRAFVLEHVPMVNKRERMIKEKLGSLSIRTESPDYYEDPPAV